MDDGAHYSARVLHQVRWWRDAFHQWRIPHHFPCSLFYSTSLSVWIGELGCVGLPSPSTAAPSDSSAAAHTSTRKNWDSIVAKIPIEDKTLKDDPNAGGDAALNTFFQQVSLWA